jgi:phenylpropionate dioxygenase-like ring-hydroxylating dioxygenase large terminal subunit
MLSAQQNDLMTGVCAGTPGGRLLRCYWHPAALSEELAPPRPVLGLRLLGQDLVLFRTETGGLALLDRSCPHRGADLAFGRLEDGGLRCAFHGWLFGQDGTCRETPAEPEGSTLAKRIRQRSYPVIEWNGIIFAYLGEGTPPALPAFDCFAAPASHSFAFKGLIECNWLQALEVGIDPAHASFLHRFFADEDAGQSYGKQFRGASAGTAIPMTRLLREHPRPSIDVETTPYGLRITALRSLDAGNTHVRVTNLAFPNAFVIPMSAGMTITQWHVPIDRTSCYWYAYFTSFTDPVDHATMRAQRLELYELPEYRARKGRHNGYGFDPFEQQTTTYTGMGADINVHDQWAVESQGAVQDRTREHLGYSDKAIVANRRLLVAAIEQVAQGNTPQTASIEASTQTEHGPIAIDAVLHSDTWQADVTRLDAERRAKASWSAGAHAA